MGYILIFEYIYNIHQEKKRMIKSINQKGKQPIFAFFHSLIYKSILALKNSILTGENVVSNIVNF